VESPPRRRHWGTFVLRIGLAGPQIVAVPRPLHETNALEFGVSWFRRGRASGLLIAGSHPKANVDGTSDVLRASNRCNVFNLSHQVLLRQLQSRPMLVIQSRALRAPVDADVVIAADDGAMCYEALTPLKRDLVDRLRRQGLRTRLVDGSPLTAGYELGCLRQGALTLGENKEMVGLWLSPSLRGKYRQQSEERLLTAQFETVGIPTVHANLFAFLSQQRIASPGTTIPDELRASVLAYLKNYDVVRLRLVRTRWSRYPVIRVIDHNSDQSFLCIAADDQSLPLVVNLTGWVGNEHRTVVSHGLDREALRHFMDSGATWLEVRQSP
jgi:hypothetical protein